VALLAPALAWPPLAWLPVPAPAGLTGGTEVPADPGPLDASQEAGVVGDDLE
jgi:hypothetical protein